MTEDLLGSLMVARDRFLKPGGCLVPGAAAIEAVPVTAERMHADLVAVWTTTAQRIDFAAARPYAANTIYYQRDAQTTPLAEPVRLHAIDFAAGGDGPVRAAVDVQVTASGLCHGWLGWLTIQLGSTWLSAGPASPRVHWTPAFLPLDPPLPLEGGEQVHVTLERLPHGDWTWSTTASAGERRHSTLLSRPLTLATIERAALDYRPRINAEGELVRHVLALCDGTRRTRDIASDVASRFPRRFPTIDAALPFVQRILRHHA